MPRKKSLGPARLRTITVFAPVPEQALDELTERLHQLRSKPSPFEAMPNTHFARLAVLPRNAARPQPHPQGMRRKARLLDLLTHLGRAQKADPPSVSYLMFSASYDADPHTQGDADYVEQLRQRLDTAADRIWELCSDYPGRSDQAKFLAFFTQRCLPPAGYLFSASDQEPTVGQIQSALQLRQKVIDLAVATDGVPDEKLHEQFLTTFGRADEHRSDRPVPGQQLPPVAADVAPALVDPPTGADQLAQVDRKPATDPDLIDVQNFVTSGYPRHHVSRHLLLRITDPPAARRWLAQVADSIPTAGWAEQFVDRIGSPPADDTLPEDPGTRSSTPEFAVHVALSYAGLVRLGLAEAELAGFASEFRAGMAGREASLTPGRGTSTWQPPFQAPVHLLVMFSAADGEALNAQLEARPELLPGAGHGLHVLDTVEAGRIPEDRYGSGGSAGKPGFLEHFGFVDGLSQPRIHGVTAGRRTAELPAGEVLLGYEDVDGDTAGAGLPTALAKNGSYLVYRKLEQDVPAFRALTRQLAQRLNGKHGGTRDSGTDPEELAAAKLMGRWRDGTPLTLSPSASDPALARKPFGFQEHDAQGLGCPVGAHIRRANPRDSRPVDPNTKLTDGGHPGLEAELAQRHRMLRRGIPYGRPLAESESTDAATDLATKDLGADDERRGLLFIALVGDIRRQFEFVQAHWMSDGNAFRLGNDRDPFSGASQQGTKLVVQGNPPAFLQPTSPLVTCRGGEYFFLPGIAALRHIATASRSLVDPAVQ